MKIYKIIENINSVDDEYELLRFVNETEIVNNCKFVLKHKKCDRELIFSYRNYVSNNRRCKFCYGKAYDTKKLSLKIKEADPNYILVGEFKNSKTPTEIKHLKCNNIFKMRPSDFLSNSYRCPECNKPKPYSFESLYEKIDSIDENYKLIEVFGKVGVRSKCKILHKTCGNTFETQVRNFLINNRRCEHCTKRKMFNPAKRSKGEMKISEFLEEKGIEYEIEKTFPDLISPFSSKKLRFDFFIDKLNTCIEFDGKFHDSFSESSDIFSKDAMDKTKIRDNCKNNYCKDNNIRLIRISYREFDSIYEILNNKLNV